MFVLWAASGRSMVISFLMLRRVATTAMMVIVIAVLPSYFGAKGKASSVSGILEILPFTWEVRFPHTEMGQCV